MHELKEREEGEYGIYEYLCTDPECDKKLIVQVCRHCEHEMRWWEE
jgi:hypothetical protein